MRLPRGYRVCGATYEDPDRQDLTATRWRAYLGDELLGDCDDPETAAASAWWHALERWQRLAERGDVYKVERLAGGWGEAELRVKWGRAHVEVYDTGKLSFGGTAPARQRLASRLRELGMLRGCGHRAQGGEWDLPAGAPEASS